MKEYNAPMLNEIMPRVYKRLRQMAGLSKTALAPLLKTSRYTVRKIESGKSLPTAAQVEKLLELAGCTHERSVEMAGEELGRWIGKPVGILPHGAAHAAPTLLEQGEMLVNEYPHRLPALLVQALRDRMKTV